MPTYRLVAINNQQQTFLDMASAVVAQGNTQYLVVDATSGQTIKELVLKKQGDDLAVEVDGETVVTIESFYSEVAVQFNNGKITVTGEAIVITSASPVEVQTNIVWQAGESGNGARAIQQQQAQVPHGVWIRKPLRLHQAP